MANAYVEIHDPLSNHGGRLGSTDCDPTPTSDTDSMSDTEEFRIIMVYAQRTRPEQEVNSHLQENGNGTTPSQTLAKTEKEEKKKKKKKKMGWKRIFGCVHPRTKEDGPEQTAEAPLNVSDRSGRSARSCVPGVVTKQDDLEEVASRLRELVDGVEFRPSDLETDAEENEVERAIALLLRESGDRMNETVLKDANIAIELFWNYDFFKRIVTGLLEKLGLGSPNAQDPAPQAKTQMAMTCEVTSRLSAVTTLPSSRLLNHGARYLQDYFSAWARQQGGYEAAIDSDEDEVQ